ncbi:hypothetical protein HDU97_002699 [Phlyctochytrium planicorne]|nr:hypothetical protein HDU97_002699 [Phlyctochytrium planicorne]
MELAKGCLRKIQKLNPSINAFSYIRDTADILADVTAAESRRSSGLAKSDVDGLLVAIKDNIAVRGLPLSCASGILKDMKSPYDASAVETLKKNGCVIVGRTNMDEFGMGSATTHSIYGPARNPLHVDHVAGGSSGGSAAAVSAGMVDIALGSDTGGSVRLPASYCGVYGFKPSYGMLSSSFAGYFQQAQKLRTLITQDFERVFGVNQQEETTACVDVLLTPASIGPAPSFQDMHSTGSVAECINDVMTLPSSLAGIPALVIPSRCFQPDIEETASKLPVGIQLLAPYGQDEFLLELASSISRQK